MKKIILFFFCTIFIGITQLCRAGDKIDSLLQVLKVAKEDTSKVNTLNLMSREYFLAGDFDLSRKYSTEALVLSGKLHFEKGKAISYLNYGITYFNEGKYPEALKKFEKALSISQKINDKKIIAKCYNNMGLVYTYQSNYSEALKFHQKSLQINKEIGDSAGIEKSYGNIGIIYEEQANYAEAIKYYYASLKLAEALGDKKRMGDAYFNLGNASGGNLNYAGAIKYHLQALKLYEEIGFKQGVGLVSMNMGAAYQELDSLELALNFCQRSFKILDAIGNRVGAAQAKNIMAHINTKLGNYSQSLDDFSESLKVFSEMGDTFNISTSYRGIGEVYFHQGEYNEALKNFNLGLEMAKVVGNNSNIIAFYSSLSEVFEKKNDYKNAYINHKLYFALYDSILNEKKNSQIAEMQTKFETEKKDNEIILLNKDKEIQHVEIKKQKLLMYFSIGGLCLVIVLLLLGYRTYKTRQTLRLSDIRNKIAGDLHDDIGSTLNSISIYSEVARKKDEQQDEALEMIGEASRKIIDAMSDIVWTVTPENDSFAKIIFRMKSFAYNLFRAKKIEFTFQSDESLNEKKLSLEGRRNLYLIFKEAVNNLVKYSGATTVAITLVSENEFIKLRILDNGIGFDTAQDNIGNGLKNMKRRADEMKASFKIESSKGNGTQIELILKA